MPKVRISETPMENGGMTSGTKRVRISVVPGMAMGGSTYVPGGPGGYGNQQKGHGYALDRFWSSPAGYPGATSQVNPYARIGTTLPESKDGGDINAEKNERVLGDFDQDGQMELMNVGGKPHTQGGKDVDVPSNSFVFSDTKNLKIKDPEILARFGMTPKRGGFTPADIAKKYDLNEYKKVTDDPNADDYSTTTAQLMSDSYLAKLNKLAQVQEAMKGDMGMDHHDPNMPMARYGGTYQVGGPTRPTTPEGWNDFTRTEIAYPEEFASYPPRNPPAHGSNWMPFDPEVAAAQGYQGEPSTAAYQRFANLHGAGLAVDNKMGELTTGWQNPDGPIAPLPTGPTAAGMGNPNADDSYYNLTPYAGNQSGALTPNPPPPPLPQHLENKIANNRGTGNKWDIGIDPNFYGNAQNVLNIAGLKKFVPYEAPPQAVIPDTVFLDPTRAIAAQAEEARSGSEMDAMSANPQAARAMGLARQGIAGKQAADTIGQYHNQNVGIANQANAQAAQITNQLMEKQANRLAELNKANFLSDREYQKQLKNLHEEFAYRLQEQHNANVNLSAYNAANPYFYRDKQGYSHLKPGITAAKLADIYAGKGSQPTAVMDNYYKILSEIQASHPPRDEKDAEQQRDAAWNQSGLGERKRTSYNASGDAGKSTVSGQPIGPLMKMGGSTDLYNNTKLKKFMK